jgi:excisionase family DNA binding protein
VNNNSGVMHQPINVDGTVTQCVITIHFSPGPESKPGHPSTEIPDGKLLLRINDAAERLSLSRTNLYKILMSGELESIKIGRSRLIPTDALESFVNRYRNNRL